MNNHIGIICKAAVAGVALAAAATTPATAAQPEPFKLTNIHFETNASACDMGIQISFDTDGITEGSVEDPNDQVVYSFRAVQGLEGTHDQTEGFQERVEPPIIDLEYALGCEPSTGSADAVGNDSHSLRHGTRVEFGLVRGYKIVVAVAPTLFAGKTNAGL